MSCVWLIGYDAGVDLGDDPDETRFRTALRRWLADNVPTTCHPFTTTTSDPESARRWGKALATAGYAGLTWPTEYGGRGLPPSYQAIYLEECVRAQAPEHIGSIGLGMVGPTLIAHGTTEQRRRHLGRILDGRSVFCQGFSEPEAGSDLSAVRTRIDRDTPELVINGHKVWSSYAHLADHCLLLGRSEPADTGHAGLTCVLLDMRSPGVLVRPQRQITGEATFGEIVLTDVRVPESEVVGAMGDGWRIAMTTLAHERGTHACGLTARLEVTFGRLLETIDAVGAADDAVVRDQIAEMWVQLQGLRFTNYRSLTALLHHGRPGPEGSAAKLRWSRLNQRLCALAVDLLERDGALDSEDGFWGGYWQHQLLHSRGNSIEGGTSEVLRTVIAERVLGLPRSR